MDPNVPEPTLDLFRMSTKIPLFINAQRNLGEANSTGAHTSSPREQVPRMNHEKEILFPIIGLEPNLEKLSRLRAYPNLGAGEDFRSPRPTDGIAPDAQSIKRALITRLISGHESKMDIKSMIDMTNAAFELLSSFKVEFGHLYDAVKVFIYYHLHILEADDMLKRNGSSEELLLEADLCAKSREVANALRRCNVVLAHTCTTMFLLEAQTSHTMEELSQIEGQLAKTHAELLALQRESTRLQKTYDEVKAEHTRSSKNIGEKMMKEQEINIHRDHVITGIDEMKGKLGTLYWSNFDN